MNEKELEAFNMLVDMLYRMPTICIIVPDATCMRISEREGDNDVSILSIYQGKNLVESDRKILETSGDPAEIALWWPYGVDMVLINHYMATEKEYRKTITYWKTKIVNNGIFAFCNYDHKDYPHVKPAVDAKMTNSEAKIAHVDNLVAYKIIDPATQISWDMISKSYERHAVVQ